jgi:hypothetical protein
VVGPVWLGGAMYVERVPVEDLRAGHGQKIPVIVRWRHEATITVDRPARSYARLLYGSRRPRFRRTPTRVRFVACKRIARGEHGSLPPDHVRSSFWPGGIRTNRAPVCVPLTIRIDRREPVHRTVGMGMRCPQG